ncbi:unnamed protein product [Candidula unifasciata]|uniref:Uncharacterized protein n=1 Tax=Candidula unifasciata TaxID=100452 RepID=A0A8S3ZDX0_9EUPU|nr:unnamed protein product [Candidula unifasciata]
MSNNSSVETNASQWFSYRTPGPNMFTYYYRATVTLDTIFIVAGTLINVWFLAAILLSRELRSRMRNKFICGLLVVNLAETFIHLPMSVIRGVVGALYAYHLLNCHFISAANNIYHIIDFVGNWYILILVCVYMAQILTFEPQLTPVWKNIVTAVIFTAPCVFAVLLVPLTMKTFSPIPSSRCLINSPKATEVYRSLDTIVPQVLASLLLIATAVVRQRRYPYARFFASRTQLTVDRSQTDPWSPFVALLVTAVASDFGLVVVYMNATIMNRLDSKTWLIVYFTIKALSYLRVILLPLMLLLFPDIRERTKAWRPCRRSASSPADLVVTYERNTS